MLTSVWRRHRRLTILASLLALALLAVVGFPTAAGAAALQHPYAPAGATGTGSDAPPPGSEPLMAGKAWDAKHYRIPEHAKACPQPPQSAAARFALADSPTLLDYYGLPRPSVYNDIATWQSIVATMTHHSCDSSVPVVDG